MAPKSPEQEAEVLKQFREECIRDGVIPEESEMNDDFVLTRFLRARQYNIPKAKAMLKNCREWRQTVGGKGIDDLYRRMDPFDYPERADVFKHWPLWFHKVDKKGRPVNVHRFGGVNVSELYKAVSPDRLLDSLYVNCESLTREILPACSNLAQRQIGTVLVIVDLKGFSIGQFWQIRDLAQKSFQISQDYYPETMGQVKIINAPSSFTAMWAVMKPWLAKETVDKIDVLGSDYQRELLAVVDADNLPASLGGNCTCDDCGGCAFSSAGPWMAGRKERREKWLKGERASIALGMDERPADVEGKELVIEKAKEANDDAQAQPNGDAHALQAGGGVTPGKEDEPEFVEINKEDVPADASPKETRAQQGAAASSQESTQPEGPEGAETKPQADEDESPAEAAARRAALGLAAPVQGQDEHADPESSKPGTPAEVSGKVYKASAAADFREAVVGDDVSPSEAPGIPSQDASGEPTTSANGVLPPGLEPSAPSSATQPHVVTAPPATKQAIAGDRERSPSPSALDTTATNMAPPAKDSDAASKRSAKGSVASRASRKTKSRISTFVSRIMHPRHAQGMPS